MSRFLQAAPVALAALLALVLLPDSSQAQRSIALEIRGDLNFPTGDFGDAPGLEAKSEAGFGAGILFPILPQVSLYAGGSREMFGCEACEGSDEILSTGVEAGAKLHVPIDGNPILPFLKAGAIYHKADVSIQGIEGESDWGLGFQLAGGAEIRLGDVLSFTSALRYQRFTAEFEPLGLEFLSVDTDVSFLSLDLGMLIRVGGY